MIAFLGVQNIASQQEVVTFLWVQNSASQQEIITSTWREDQAIQGQIITVADVESSSLYFSNSDDRDDAILSQSYHSIWTRTCVVCSPNKDSCRVIFIAERMITSTFETPVCLLKLKSPSDL